MAKGFPRYRYIYAVEQFKKYHADEQWVAIGEDVFENPNDKYLKELKKQCVYNGFGLISMGVCRSPEAGLNKQIFAWAYMGIFMFLVSSVIAQRCM